ncbi:MAG: hypothetical protein ACW964_19870, partial [Candidatus Hodarchaeales archaeon]
IISPLYQSEPSGALIIETIPDFPASQAGIKAGYAIIAINTSDGFHQIASSLDFHDYSSSSILPSQNLTFYFADDVNPISLITVPREDNASKGFIGIRTWEYFAPHASSSILFLNLIPVPFLDGDKLLTSFLGPRFEKHIKWIRYFALGVLGLNIILSLAFMGWQQI